MKTFLLASVTIALISAQNSLRPGSYKHNPTGDAGEPYIHDTTGDFGPYYYFKLRKQAEKEAARSGGAPVVKTVKQKPAPLPAPVQQVASPVQQAAAPARSGPPAPARQQQRFTVRARVPQQVPQRRIAPQQPARAPAPAPANNDPHFAGLRFQFQIQAPEFNYQNNFAENAYAFSSPFYSTNAQGGTYSYAAIY